MPCRDAKTPVMKVSAKHLLGERHAKMQIIAEISSFYSKGRYARRLYSFNMIS
ncbi:hypothetical protein RHEC894_PD00500 (plasmid) [Rhizobium sp. CIAT894]|nr:hypothetical protein RHEC894_PD00500 [Rhizobium sp. CIAT894]